jgi:predicted Zn-dependent peptidase
MEQVHLVFALEGRSLTDPLRRSLQIFAYILGGDMSSRLFREAREARGLCYSVDASHWEWTDTGLFIVYCASDADKLPELIKVIDEQTRRAVDTITDAEVSRAKAQFKSWRLMAMEGADGRAGALGIDVLIRGRPVSLQEFAAEIDAVTVDSARLAGRHLIGGSRPAIVALGPPEGIAVVTSIPEMFGHSIS